MSWPFFVTFTAQIVIFATAELELVHWDCEPHLSLI